MVRKSAKSVDLATKLALDELGLSISGAEVTIISEGNKGFLGLGAKDACVEVRPKNASTPVKDSVKAVEPPVRHQQDDKAENNSSKKQVEEKEWSSEEIQTASDNATTFLTDLLKSMDITAAVKTSFENGILSISLTSPALGIIIGKRGETLDSIQYLTSLVVNRKSAQYIRISLDAENYRAKREEALVRLAQKLARKVKDSKRKYTLEPMSPYERRIIHASLQSNSYVTTFSIGEEPYRKVVIAPKR